MENDYVDGYLKHDWTRTGDHRAVIGGLWDEIGKLQFDYMCAQGLQPSSTLVDIGCGALRGGVYFIPYLESGHYFGFDINASLIEVGLKNELSPEIHRTKIVSENFHSAPDFIFPNVWREIDVALSISLFTHLNINSITLCLHNTHAILKPGALYHSTVFLADHSRLHDANPRPHELTTYAHRDPYHYSVADLEFIAERSGYSLLSVSEFGHPRGQHMAVFQRLEVPPRL